MNTPSTSEKLSAWLKHLLAVASAIAAMRIAYTDICLIPLDFELCFENAMALPTNHIEHPDHPLNFNSTDHFKLLSSNGYWYKIPLLGLFIAGPVFLSLYSKNLPCRFASLLSGIAFFYIFKEWINPDFIDGHFHDCDRKGSFSGMALILAGLCYFFIAIVCAISWMTKLASSDIKRLEEQTKR